MMLVEKNNWEFRSIWTISCFVFVLKNHCHRVTTQLQQKKYYYYYYYYGEKGHFGDDLMVGSRQEFAGVVLLTVCIDQYVQKGECECC
jgi:hypothetical protein